MVKTIPVSPEIHKLIKTVSVNYDVTIQEATARIIWAGAKALELEPPIATKQDRFWQLATQAAEDMEKHGTNDIATIEAAVKKARKARGQKKAK